MASSTLTLLSPLFPNSHESSLKLRIPTVPRNGNYTLMQENPKLNKRVSQRREILKGLASLPLLVLGEAKVSEAREAEVGSYLPPSPTDPSFFVFKASPKDTPALRAGNVQPYQFLLPPVKSLKKQWYNVLGNHDYRGDAEAQLSSLLRKIDSRWLCLRSFIVNAELAEIIFVDTTPFVDTYILDPEGHTYDWRGVTPRKPYITNLLNDVESALRESTAKWKIVVGHHAIRSVGHHADTEELVTHLLPILKEA